MILNLTSFEKSYGAHRVIKPLDLEIGEGLTWLKGINGSGKSTLMKSIAGIIPSEGEIAFDDGLSLRKSANQFRKRVHYTPAEPTFPLFLSGDEILQFYLKTRKSSPEQLSELCKLFGVDEYMNNKISSYSSGMLKKVSLVTGFIGKPTLLALDEPFTTIDKATQEILTDVIQENLQKGVNIIIASHHEVEALVPSISRTYELDNGELQKV